MQFCLIRNVLVPHEPFQRANTVLQAQNGQILWAQAASLHPSTNVSASLVAKGMRMCVREEFPCV